MHSPNTSRNRPKGGAWVTIGAFDGVHLGHQQVIRSLAEKADNHRQLAVVVTFYPHPQKVLRNIAEPFYLNTPEEKDEIFRMLGVDSILTVHFTHQFAKTSADQFMHSLHAQLAFSNLLVGHDFRLGAGRQGDFTVLEAIGAELGYQVAAVEPLLLDGETVSSSRIRGLLREGRIAQANRLLGRPYELSGPVVHGDGRGKHIGIPTANLAVWAEKMIPATGVYAAFAEIEDQRHLSVVNIGHGPTFYEHPAEKGIEVHMLDFNQDIYGKYMRLRLVERIRPEIKFSSAAELMDRIQEDIRISKEVLIHVAT